MAGEVSFDVVSEFDEQELRNALDQVRREIQQRFDFKGVTVELTQAKEELTLVTDDEHRAAAVKDLIETKAIRRNLQPQDLRLGQGRAGRRQQGQAGHHAQARPGRRAGAQGDQAHPRGVPQGEVADPGRRGPRLREEQGRPPAGDRPAARARRIRPAPVPELPLTP